VISDPPKKQRTIYLGIALVVAVAVIGGALWFTQSTTAFRTSTKIDQLFCGESILGDTTTEEKNEVESCGDVGYKTKSPGKKYYFEGDGNFVFMSTCHEVTKGAATNFYDSRIRLFRTNTETSEEECVAGNNDDAGCGIWNKASTVQFQSEPNVLYAVYVDSPRTSGGLFELSVSCVDAPAAGPILGDTTTEEKNEVEAFGNVGYISCAAIRNRNPSNDDGEYMLEKTVDGVSTKFKVWCHNMDSDPKEYLSLTKNNFSQYTEGGAKPGQTVKTTFTKIRLNVTSLMIDINDRTFSTSVGKIYHDINVTSMPFAVAQDCSTPYGRTGRALINLSGTPFKVIGGFSKGGYLPGGGASYDSSTNSWKLEGGGYCGWCVANSQTRESYVPHMIKSIHHALELTFE